MSDVARYLPLSQTAREDESGVSSDWSGHLGTVLTSLAALVDTLRPEELDAPALAEGYRVRDALGHLIWSVGTSRSVRARSVVRQMLASRQGRSAAVRALSTRAAEGSAQSFSAALRALATTAASPDTRASIAELSAAVVDGLDVAHSTGRLLAVDGVAVGAVALARSLSAPTPIRAVVRQRTLRASDADWSVGTGRELRAPAAQIVLFLWGRADVPREVPA
jgi:hypothetical protein